VLTDVVAMIVGWTWMLVVVGDAAASPVHGLLRVAVAVGSTSLLLTMQHLYRTMTCSLRSRELRGVARSCAGAAVAVLALPQPVSGGVPAALVGGGALVTFALLGCGRGVFTMWLRAQRSAGRYTRRVLLVGDNAEAAGLLALVRDHTELGYEICGYVGRRDAAQMTTPWLGDWTQAATAVRAAGATGALIATTALDPVATNRVVRQLLDRDVHVRLSCGLRGITQQRLVPTRTRRPSSTRRWRSIGRWSSGPCVSEAPAPESTASASASSAGCGSSTATPWGRCGRSSARSIPTTS
jgi:FlaA1/EpsC-like NDP-sugar epimerase